MTDSAPNQDSGSTVRRRTFLLGVGAAAAVSLAGCLGEDRDPVEVETSLTVTDTESGASETLIDAERNNLDPDEYYSWELTFGGERDVEYEVEVLEGPPVNAYILTPEEYQTLSDDENDFSAVEGSIASDVESATKTLTVSGGDYFLVVMNADVKPSNA